MGSIHQDRLQVPITASRNKQLSFHWMQVTGSLRHCRERPRHPRARNGREVASKSGFRLPGEQSYDRASLNLSAFPETAHKPRMSVL